jgi:hypothetical protein
MKTRCVSEPVPTNEIPDGTPDARANTALVATLLLNPAAKALALTVAELVSRMEQYTGMSSYQERSVQSEVESGLALVVANSQLRSAEGSTCRIMVGVPTRGAPGVS